jgi:hypothetical protein
LSGPLLIRLHNLGIHNLQDVASPRLGRFQDWKSAAFFGLDGHMANEWDQMSYC